MRKTEIEKKLKIAISNSIPDVLDNILIKCEQRKGLKNNMEIIKVEDKTEKENKMKKLFWSKLAGVAIVAMLCIGGVFGFDQYSQSYTVESIVEFDVNPSVELQVNKKEKIVEAVALNEDGKKIIGDMDLKNADINVAVNAIVGSMLKNGYLSIDANSILVSVKNNNIEKANQLQEKISKEVEELLKANSINGSVLSQMYQEDVQVKTLAKENNVSEGKAKLINEALKSEIKDSNGNLFTFEQLSNLSINELNLLLTSKQTQLNNIKATGSASENSYVGREKAKEIAYANAQVTEANVTRVQVELDYDDGKLVYEVEFYIDNVKYKYEIDAKSGAILEIDRDNNNKITNNSSNNNSSSNNSNSNNNNNNNSANISREKAKEIAYTNAKVAEVSVRRVEIELDQDDGKLVYEVEFYVGNVKYKYEIDAKSGAILEVDRDNDE